MEFGDKGLSLGGGDMRIRSRTFWRHDIEVLALAANAAIGSRHRGHPVVQRSSDPIWPEWSTNGPKSSLAASTSPQAG